MRRTSYLLAAAAALSLALAPGLAEARAGGGSSAGSRGSMTQSAPPSTRTAPNQAQPMQRTQTPAPTPGAAAQSPSRGGMFMSGLMGGLIGAGIGGLLLGSGFFGSGMGMAGFLGFLLQIGLIALAVYFIVRLIRGRQQAQPAMAGGPNMFARGAMPEQAPIMGGGAAAAPVLTRPINIAQADYQQFENLLHDVQKAWSHHDLNALRAMATPEMVGYFSEQISQQTSRGLRNEVSDTRLESGDLAEAWAEGDREYATVALRFSMVDVTRDTGGRVVDGSPNERTTATEIWTFVRPRGGQWALSAIQQTR